jgi:hypothetical protein
MDPPLDIEENSDRKEFDDYNFDINDLIAQIETNLDICDQ